MEYLLDNWDNPNSTSNNDDSYLYHYGDNANYMGVKLMIEGGANVMYKNNTN